MTGTGAGATGAGAGATGAGAGATGAGAADSDVVKIRRNPFLIPSKNPPPL